MDIYFVFLFPIDFYKGIPKIMKGRETQVHIMPDMLTSTRQEGLHHGKILFKFNRSTKRSLIWYPACNDWFDIQQYIDIIRSIGVPWRITCVSSDITIKSIKLVCNGQSIMAPYNWYAGLIFTLSYTIGFGNTGLVIMAFDKL